MRSLRGGRCRSFRREQVGCRSWSSPSPRSFDDHHHYPYVPFSRSKQLSSPRRLLGTTLWTPGGDAVQIRKSTSPRPAVISGQITSTVTTLPRSDPHAVDDSACRWADGEFGFRSFAWPATAMEIRKRARQGEDGRCAGPQPALDRRRARCITTSSVRFVEGRPGEGQAARFLGCPMGSRRAACRARLDQAAKCGDDRWHRLSA